jgi:hypothetical protein
MRFYTALGNQRMSAGAGVVRPRDCNVALEGRATAVAACLPVLRNPGNASVLVLSMPSCKAHAAPLRDSVVRFYFLIDGVHPQNADTDLCSVL